MVRSRISRVLVLRPFRTLVLLYSFAFFIGLTSVSPLHLLFLLCCFSFINWLTGK